MRLPLACPLWEKAECHPIRETPDVRITAAIGISLTQGEDLMAEMLYGNFRIELDTNRGNRIDRTMLVGPAVFTQRWPVPIDPPPALLGRDQELDQIRRAVRKRRPIQFYASCGFGVTTLLRFAAAGRPGVGVSAPILYLRVGDDPLPDVLHQLVSTAFDSEDTIRPTPV